jgi:hypothetical protein
MPILVGQAKTILRSNNAHPQLLECRPMIVQTIEAIIRRYELITLSAERGGRMDPVRSFQVYLVLPTQVSCIRGDEMGHLDQMNVIAGGQ